MADGSSPDMRTRMMTDEAAESGGSTTSGGGNDSPHSRRPPRIGSSRLRGLSVSNPDLINASSASASAALHLDDDDYDGRLADINDEASPHASPAHSRANSKRSSFGGGGGWPPGGDAGRMGAAVCLCSEVSSFSLCLVLCRHAY